MQQVQFDSPPRRFQVKNTFIYVDESPKGEHTPWPTPDTRRARSMPPLFDTASEDEDDSRDSRDDSTQDQVSSPLSLPGTHYSESPRPTQERPEFPARFPSWPFIPDNMMVLLPIPPTPEANTDKADEDAGLLKKKCFPPAWPQEAEAAAKKKKLTCDFDPKTGAYRVTWHVDARKLDSNDKQAISPAFEMTWKGETKTFKVMLFPEGAPGIRGADNFKKSRGRGYILLKCEDEVNHSTSVQMRLTMGEESRGPVKHDFAQNVSCGLPKRQAVWDCKKLCQDARSTLLVTLNIMPADHQELA